MLTILQENGVHEVVQAKLEENNIDEDYADISSIDGVKKVADEITFNAFASRIRYSITPGRHMGFLSACARARVRNSRKRRPVIRQSW